VQRTIVIGGGIAGLATALRIRDRARDLPGGLDLRVLEAGPRPGGNLRTDRCDGFTVERGPNGFLDNVPAMARLVERLGLTSELQKADENASQRFLFRGGRLHQLPGGPIGFLASPVLSLPGRLRVFFEPFARKRPEGVDETVHDFASRRIGSEAAEVLVDAMVSGVFAGDTRNLSLASAFPKMAAMEAEHGSLVRAMLARGRERRRARRQATRLEADGRSAAELTRPGGPAGPGGTLTSFRSGLETLVRSLAGALDGAVEVDAGPRALAYHPDGAPAWTVTGASGERLEADAVVVAVPGARAEPLLTPIDADLGEAVGGVATAGLAVVALGFDARLIGGAPAGFGFLVPRSQGPRSLGCLWDSNIFPGRAPEGAVLLRVMIGGAHDPQAVELSDAELVAIVRQDLATTMGLAAEPALTRIFRHPAGIPQYEPGHQARLDRIADRIAELPGLWVAGSSFHGIAMNACVETAERQAEEVHAFLAGAISAGKRATARPRP
jgi:oxygen-dependent protoporphyrinogen oxidase